MILRPEDINSIIDVKELVADIEKTLLNAPKPPPRTTIESRESWFGVMPAYTTGYHSVKLVGVYYTNPSRGLPLIRGVLLLLDSQTGELLLIADAGAATAWRTAAASALALKIMGFKSGNLGVIGAGVQGRHHVVVAKELFDVGKIIVYDIEVNKAENLAREVGGLAVESVEEVFTSSDAIILATTSKSPIARSDLVKSGTFIVSVGAPRPVRELDESIVKRSRCLLVDTVEGVTSESDDWVGAETLVSLSDALRGAECRWGDVRVYKSVGYSLFDLAIAIHLYRRIKEGLGVRY